MPRSRSHPRLQSFEGRVMDGTPLPRHSALFLVERFSPMAQRESRLSRVIQTSLRSHGAFVFKVWGSEMMMAGLPDLIGCYQGRFFGLETKMPEKRSNTSAVQELIMAKIRKAGGISQVICSAEEALNALGIEHEVISQSSLSRARRKRTEVAEEI